MLVACGLALGGFFAAYGLAQSYRVLLGVALLHGIFWSGLLAASAAYMTDLIPESRRAEGMGYWGLAGITAVAMAPALGFWLYDRGWRWLCGVNAALSLVMASIAFCLEERQLRTVSHVDDRHGLGLVRDGKTQNVAKPNHCGVQVAITDTHMIDSSAVEKRHPRTSLP